MKFYVSQLSQATGQHPANIYGALYSVFKVLRYQELLEAQWEQVERWFQAQLGWNGVTLLTREKGVTKAMNNHTNKRKKRPPRRSPWQANTVRIPLPCVMLLCWMRSYTGDEECSCGASPDYEIDSFVDAEGLLEAEGPGEKDQLLRFSLEQQRNGAFAVYQTFLVCRQHALQLFTDLYGEQDAQQALSPLLLGISNLTVTVGREITTANSPHGTLQVSYTNATTVSEVIEAHTGYIVTKIPKRPSAE